MKIEEWRFVTGYEGLYMVSNWGRVKSMNYKNTGKEGIMTGGKDNNGYLIVTLCKHRKQKTHTIHTLVYDAFGDAERNGRILQVDHINNDKTDNRIENLQLLNHRENNSKKIYKNKSSQYKGVYWHKYVKKWQASINIDGKLKYLGIFSTELEANEAYLKAKENFEFFKKD